MPIYRQTLWILYINSCQTYWYCAAIMAFSGWNRSRGTKFILFTINDSIISIEYQGINFRTCFYWQGVLKVQAAAFHALLLCPWCECNLHFLSFIINPVICQRSNVHWMLMTDWAVMRKVVAEIDASTDRDVFLRV